MSYGQIVKYKVIPETTYQIIRNCSGCGCKNSYICTNEFRVNANGNKVDVWLIYQCEKCKHTYNLPIYERVRPDEISKEYERFLANDKVLAYKYGTDKRLFLRNKAEMDLQGMSYRLEELASGAIHTADVENRTWHKGDCIHLENPYHIKVREDKIFTQILGLTRSKVKELETSGQIRFEKNLAGLCCLINTTIHLE